MDTPLSVNRISDGIRGFGYEDESFMAEELLRALGNPANNDTGDSWFVLNDLKSYLDTIKEVDHMSTEC